ncbi:peptidylprolyl isomerase [bacterium]|nr:peptidylprolyl isomerase [bacterium]
MRKASLLTLLAAVILIWSCEKQGDYIAKVGKETIGEQEYRDAFMARFRSEDNIKQRTLDDRKRFLREMALERAKYQEGISRKYDENTAIAEQVEAAARRRSLDMLYEEKIMNSVINEKMLRDFYEKSGKEISARHILLKKMPGDTTEAANAGLRARADSIKTAINGGLDFKAAAKLLSEDATTAADSGDLGWFPWGRMVGEFQEACWSASLHKLAGPVETPFGWHLIMVDSTRKIENRPSYDESKEEIAARLREVEGQKLSDAARAYVDDLHKKYDLNLDDAVLSDFRSKLQDPQISLNKELGPMFTDVEKQKVAATHKLGKVTIADMIEKVGTNAYRVDWKNAQAAIDLVNAIAEPEFLEDHAEKEGFLKKAKSDPAVVEQQRSAIMRLVEKVEISDKLETDESADKAYYEAHLQEFIQPEMRTIREIFIKEDSTKAARVAQRATKGEDFKKLAWQFNEKESTKNDTGRIGPFEEKRFGVIGRTAFTLANRGDMSGAVKIGKNWSVVQLLDVVPSRTKTWDEAMAEAKKQNRVARTSQLKEQLETMLLEKYPMNVNDEKLAALWPLPPERQERAARDQ